MGIGAGAMRTFGAEGTITITKGPFGAMGIGAGAMRISGPSGPKGPWSSAWPLRGEGSRSLVFAWLHHPFGAL